MQPWHGTFSRGFPRRPTLTAILAGALLVPALPAQSPETGGKPSGDSPDSRPRIVERTEVRLSLMEVTVLDRRDRHVRGLPASRFRLYEGKREIPILTFDEIDTDPAGRRIVTTAPEEDTETAGETGPSEAEAEPAGPSPAPRSVAEDALSKRLQGPRWFALVFDGYNNPSPLKISQARRAAKKWIDQNLLPTDLAAVYEMTPFLRSVSGFTGDAGELRRAIDSVRIFPGSSMADEMMRQKLESGGMLMGTAAQRQLLEEQLLNASRFGGDLLSAERDQFYIGVADVARVLQGLEGTRSVVVFSGGFPLTRTRSTVARGGFTERFGSMLADLESQGIRVFTFDTGVEGGFTDADVAVNTRLQVDQLGLGAEWLDRLQIGVQVDAVNAHHEILHVLGNETGGRFFRGKNYLEGLNSALDDLSHYYLVGYRPPEVIGTKYVPVRIEVEGRGLRVLARKGRFKGDAEGADDEADNRQDVAEAESPVPEEPPVAEPAVDALEVRIRPQFYPGPEGKTLAVFPIRAAGPVRGIPSGAGDLLLDLTVNVTAASGGEPVDRWTRTFKSTLKAAAAEPLRDGLLLREAVLLPPAHLGLEVEVRLNGQNLVGTWTGSIKIPERPADVFGLTDLALLSPVEPGVVVFDLFRNGQPVLGAEENPGIEDPLGESAGRPPYYSGGPFPRSVPLVVQVGVTSPPPAMDDGSSPLRLDWELIPEIGGDALAPPVRYRRLQLVPGGEMLDVVADLDLTAVPPGEYEVRVTATDVRSGATDVRRASLTLVP